MSNTKHTPMTQIGTTVRFSGGGFDVRNCPAPEALAKTVVRACNSHEKLVAACKAVIEDAEAFHKKHDISEGDEASCLKAVRAALAAAEAA